jgi:hypothetical protein
MSQLTGFSRHTPCSVSTHRSVIPPGMVSFVFQEGHGHRTIDSAVVISKPALSLVPQGKLQTTKLAIEPIVIPSLRMKVRRRCYAQHIRLSIGFWA